MNDDLELKKRLSELAYEVTQNSGTERAFSGKFYDFLKKEHISVCAVEMSYFNLTTNSSLLLVGQAFINLKYQCHKLFN